jgi:anti-sigma B factor antagonist
MTPDERGPREAGPASSFSVVSEQRDAQVRLLLRGDLDLASAPEFERAVSEASHEVPGSIVVDLSALDFLDSHGLRSILSAQRLCEESGCRLSVIPGEQAQRLFELTGLTERLPIAQADAGGGGGAP